MHSDAHQGFSSSPQTEGAMPPLRESKERISEVLRERHIPEHASQIFGGFKQFVLRWNVVDIAVGIIIGASYFAIIVPVNAFTRRERKSPIPSDPTTKKCPE